MKNILAIGLCLFLLGSYCSAQGNLQFNQVLLLDVTSPATAHTVPAGKVWKMENIAMSQSNSYAQLVMGGIPFYLENSATPFNHLPFWLPSNTSFSLLAPSGHSGKASVIEFNVVP